MILSFCAVWKADKKPLFIFIEWHAFGLWYPPN
jgi:hypothetical protein